jgi:XisH protein
MAKDIYHAIVKKALTSDGWTITHDPYPIKVLGRDYEVDLAGERFFAAQRGTQKIAVEVKSFLAPSLAYEFHGVLGQYLNYLTFMELQEPDRILFLAVPLNTYNEFFQLPATQIIVTKFSINIVVFNNLDSTIVQWIQQLEK